MAKQIPDLLTNQQKAQQVAATLQALQSEELNVQLQQQRTGAKPGDNSGFSSADGTPISYSDKLSQVKDAQRAVFESAPDAVQSLVKEQASAAAQAELDAQASDS